MLEVLIRKETSFGYEITIRDRKKQTKEKRQKLVLL